MTLEKISSNRLIVELCKTDMANLFLDYKTMNIDDIKCRTTILRIVQLACYKYGIDINNKKIFIEAKETNTGCIFEILINSSLKKHLKLTNKNNGVCFNFGSLSNLLNAIEAVYKLNVCCNKNYIYKLNKQYYLFFDYPAIPKSIRKVLTEYCVSCCTKVDISRICEAGTKLCNNNAITNIGKLL